MVYPVGITESVSGRSSLKARYPPGGVTGEGGTGLGGTGLGGGGRIGASTKNMNNNTCLYYHLSTQYSLYTFWYLTEDKNY